MRRCQRISLTERIDAKRQGYDGRHRMVPEVPVMTAAAVPIMIAHAAVEQDELETMLVRRHEERASVHDKYRLLAREPGPRHPPVTEERIDAMREVDDGPHQLVSEGPTCSARAGRVFRDFAVRPCQLRQSNGLAVLTFLRLLVPVLCIVTLIHHTVNRLESTSERGLGLLCDTGPAEVVGEGHGGQCKFFSLFSRT
jgi:hypothetical protein